MVGVDFVINALLEISGFRWGGDCAREIPHTMIRKTSLMNENFIGLAASTVLRRVEWGRGKNLSSPRSLPVLEIIAVLDAVGLLS